ncbi:MAG: PfkB family carbohydrate kinase [Planctomycetaceae bacterium]|nr:PfkB family carbohydrate kinase [Planctomycetaceae bacterium]
MITLDRLETVLRTLPRLTIGLVGDLFLDRYLELVPGSREMSIETGLEAYQVERVRNSPGALGTVLNNLAALGVGLLVPVSVIGDDGHGFDLLKELRKLPVDPEHILCVPERLTPTYTKPMRPIHRSPHAPREETVTRSRPAVRVPRTTMHELNRLDVRTRSPLSPEVTAQVCRRVEQVFRTSDGLIVLDQLVDENCGVVNAQVRATLARLAADEPRKLIYVDSRRFLGAFGAATLKGNRSEVLAAARTLTRSVSEDILRRSVSEECTDNEVATALSRLADRNSRPAFCTVGERGILVARPGLETTLVPGCPAAGPVDIVGAGDAATSGIVTALLAGCDELEAAAVGNLVASITVQQLGTTGTASPEQVRQRWREMQK